MSCIIYYESQILIFFNKATKLDENPYSIKLRVHVKQDYLRLEHLNSFWWGQLFENYAWHEQSCNLDSFPRIVWLLSYIYKRMRMKWGNKYFYIPEVIETVTGLKYIDLDNIIIISALIPLTKYRNSCYKWNLLSKILMSILIKRHALNIQFILINGCFLLTL